MNVNKTLDERGKVYGDYLGGANLRGQIMDLILDRYKSTHKGERLPKTQESMIWDIVNKLTRLAVSPTHLDTWHDIAGYATLVENGLKGEEDARKQHTTDYKKPC